MGKWWQENQQAITVGVTGIAIGGMAIATVLSAGAAAPLLAATIATTLGTTAATGATLATLALAGVATAGGVSIATGAMSIGSTIPSENNVLKPVVNSPTFQVVQGGSILVSTLGTATLAPYAQMGQQAKQEQAATNNTKPAAGQASKGASSATPVKTPYGSAVQDVSDEALRVRKYVEQGGDLYRGGTLGRSNTTDAQFWATESPLSPGYSDKYGVDFDSLDYVIKGSIKSGTDFVTRPAPGLGNNIGGAIEVVTSPNSVKLDYFHMLGGK